MVFAAKYPDIMMFVPSLRLINLVFWSMILLWAQPAYARTLMGKARDDDWPHLAVGASGFALIGFQLRQIQLIGVDKFDYWMIALLIVSISAAIISVIFLHYRQTPEPHKRAILWAHGVIVLLCIVGGLI